MREQDIGMLHADEADDGLGRFFESVEDWEEYKKTTEGMHSLFYMEWEEKRGADNLWRKTDKLRNVQILHPLKLVVMISARDEDMERIGTEEPARYRPRGEAAQGKVEEWLATLELPPPPAPEVPSVPAPAMPSSPVPVSMPAPTSPVVVIADTTPAGSPEHVDASSFPLPPGVSTSQLPTLPLSSPVSVSTTTSSSPTHSVPPIPGALPTSPVSACATTTSSSPSPPVSLSGSTSHDPPPPTHTPVSLESTASASSEPGPPQEVERGRERVNRWRQFFEPLTENEEKKLKEKVKVQMEEMKREKLKRKRER
jgi:hypothetical protein